MGARIRELRGETSQDALVREIRRAGLGWTRSTLTKVELGQRAVGLDEIFILALALDVPLFDFIPGKSWIQLTRGTAMHGQALQALLAGKDPGALGVSKLNTDSTRFLRTNLATLSDTIQRAAAVWPDASAAKVLAAREAASGEAERRAARRLGLHPEELSLLAYRLWAHSLTQERETRLLKRGQAGDKRALRGHVTQELDLELIQIRDKRAKETKPRAGKRRRP